MSTKQAKLREIVGEVEEEEPEGEAVAGPSGGATMHSSGITPSLLSFSLLSIYAYTYTHIFFSTSLLYISLLSFSLFLADKSTDEEIFRPKTKEEEDVDILCSWVQVGGSLLNWRRRHGGFCWKWVYFLFSFGFYVTFNFFSHSYPCIFFIFYRLDLLKRAGTLWEEAHKLEMASQHLEAEGLEKMEAAVAGWEMEVFMGFCREQCHIPPDLQPHLLIRKSVMPICHQFPICPLRSPQDLMSLSLKTRQWRLSLQLLLQLQRRPSSPICNPFAFSWGDQRCIPMSGWGLQGGSINLPCYYLYTCMQSAPGVGLVCPSCSKTFFNLDTFLHHK